MFKKSGAYVLVFLLLAAWVGLVIFIIRSEQSEGLNLETTSTNYSTKAYSINELKAMAELNENSRKSELNIENYFVIEEQDIFFEEYSLLVGDVISQEKETRNELNNLYQGAVDKKGRTENILIEIPKVDSEVIQYPSMSTISLEIVNEKESTKNIPDLYTGRDFLDIYNTFEQNQNLDFLTKYIYNIKDVDDYIKQKAKDRGYQQRGFARSYDLVNFENVQTRPEVKKAYVAMRNEMIEKDIRLHFVSGYRSSSSQRAIFKQKMEIANPLDIITGVHDEKLDNILSRSAIPSYSKHHSGYAVDFGCGNDYLVFSFANTPCYDWLSANNFANARNHGFIPSYPDDVGLQGPNPEPWEYVWVGKDNI